MTNRSVIEKVSSELGEKKAQTRLSRSDWLQAAVQMLVLNGVDSVRITRLADALGVTRGSFYWHFADRTELLKALLEVWNTQNTAGIVVAASTTGGLRNRILALFETWLDPERFDPLLDLAVRDWARNDSSLEETIAGADRERLDALIAMFADHGFSREQSIIRARNFYYTQMGYYALRVREPLADRLSFVPTYYHTYTGEDLPSDAERAFRQHIISRKELWGDEVIPAS